LGTHQDWKAEIAVKHGVDIMFDDDPNVVLACHKCGIRAITVSEFI
jgi:acid phosphatase class B